MNRKNKGCIVRIVISWLLPIMVTVVMVFGIVFFCLERELESGIFTSLAIIYVVWAIIITCRIMLWVHKKIGKMSEKEGVSKDV